VLIFTSFRQKTTRNYAADGHQEKSTRFLKNEVEMSAS